MKKKMVLPIVKKGEKERGHKGDDNIKLLGGKEKNRSGKNWKELS